MLSNCRIWVCLLMFALQMGAPHYIAGQSMRDPLIARGDSAYRVFANEQALSFYRQALAIDTTQFLSRLKVARTHYDVGLDEKADGRTSDARASFEASVHHSRRLIAHHPDSARAHFLHAMTSGNLALFSSPREKVMLGRQVEISSKRAIELDSTLAYPYVSLGIYYREVSALSWFEKTLVKMFFGGLPDTSTENILHLLREGLRLKSDFPFLHFELAKTYMAIGRQEEARHHLQTVLTLAPESSQDKRNQGRARTMLDALDPQPSGSDN